MAKYVYLEYIDPARDDTQTFSLLHVYSSMKAENGYYIPSQLYVNYPYMVMITGGKSMVPSRWLGSTFSTNMINAQDPLWLYKKSNWVEGSKCSFKSNDFAIEFKVTFKDIFKNEAEIKSLQNKYKDGLKVLQYVVNRWIYTNTNKSHRQLSQIKWCEKNSDNDLILKTWKRDSTSKWEANLYVIADQGNIITGHDYVLSRDAINTNGTNKNLSDYLSFVFDWASSYDIIDMSFLEIRLLPSSTTTIAKNGDYDIGSEATNIGKGVCFYCNDYTTSQHLSYFPSWIKSPFLTIKSSKTHSCKVHGSSPVIIDSTTGAKTESYNSVVAYPPKNTGEPLPKELSLDNVTKLDKASIGNYVDGVARTPFLMLELRANDEAEKGYNISIPANSIVSFNHERHMRDSYNTFTLQIFDKDAMEVEAKLILGFRTVVFYYTDFVSKSKRYKGLILDYKTTIVNKGIMLTITGYSTNLAKSYIGKDSIPWSKLCEANSTSFYYWMNEAGEYHGEVRLLKDGTYGDVYNSSEGTIVTPSYNTGDMRYMLKVENTSESADTDVKYKWVSYTEYYQDYPDKEMLEYFRPTPHIYRLGDYNENLSRILSLNTGLNLSDRRPSDIVKLICIINNWSYKIVETKRVSEIPDQVSMSYIEYIKEKLLGISVSEGSQASANYLFYFDDDGVAHYEPYKVKETANVKKLYFNSVEHKDSYPLIGFTSSSNGSVLMAVNAKNSMEAINAFTGDALSLSSVVDASDDPKYLGAIIETSEWYSTSKLMQDKDTKGNLDYVKLVTWQNKNTLPSETELRNELVNAWGRVAMYTWRAQLEVAGVTDIVAGDTIDIYIYLDEGARTNDPISKEIKVGTNDDGSKDITYKGNLTMHHSSGRYVVHKITDQISAGRYVSSMEVLKIDSSKVNELISFDAGTQSETTSKTVVN